MAAKLAKDTVFDSSLRASAAVRSRCEGVSRSRAILAFCDASCAQLRELRDSMLASCWMPIHGDFNPTNLLFGQEAEVTAVFDFDSLHLDHPFVDLACGIIYMTSLDIDMTSQGFRAVPQCFNVSAAKEFLDQYMLHFPAAGKYINDLTPIAVSLAIKTCMYGLLKGTWTDKNLDALRRFISVTGETFNSFYVGCNREFPTEPRQCWPRAAGRHNLDWSEQSNLRSGTE
jgi:hypothetical protein